MFSETGDWKMDRHTMMA